MLHRSLVALIHVPFASTFSCNVKHVTTFKRHNGPLELSSIRFSLRRRPTCHRFLIVLLFYASMTFRALLIFKWRSFSFSKCIGLDGRKDAAAAVALLGCCCCCCRCMSPTSLVQSADLPIRTKWTLSHDVCVFIFS